MDRRTRSASATNSVDVLRSALKSQYHASLAMLRAAIKRCPDDLWIGSDSHANPIWRIVYHTLYYTHLYLQPNNWTFRPWAHHQQGIQRMNEPLKTGRPYTKTEMPAYWSICEAMIDDAVDALDLCDPQSGFSWYKVPKMELQIINVRHIQYHQAQLADRLRAATGAGVGSRGRAGARPRVLALGVSDHLCTAETAETVRPFTRPTEAHDGVNGSVRGIGQVFTQDLDDCVNCNYR